MAVSYSTGPNNPTAATTGVGGSRDGLYPTSWQNPNNIFVNDGVFAQFFAGGSGWYTSPLTGNGYGFKIPGAAVITGVLVEINWTVTALQSYAVGLNGVGANTNKFTGSAIGNFYQYGGDGDLWGATLTPTIVNSANFGASFAATVGFGSSGGTAQVDNIRITIFWKFPVTDVPKRYIYKVYSGSNYLGDLPNVTSDFSYSQDLNTGGAQINIDCALTTDVRSLPNTAYTDEQGNPYTDENNNPLTTEGVAAYVGPGNSTALIRNGNKIVVVEFGYYYPNGHNVFVGHIERWEADFGGNAQEDKITMLVYSDGSDLDNYLLLGGSSNYTIDQNQGNQNTAYTDDYQVSSKITSWDFIGQEFTTGAGVTNIAAMNLAVAGTAQLTIAVFTNAGRTTQIGSVTSNINVAGITELQFVFTNRMNVIPNTKYFFTVEAAQNNSFTIYYNNTTVYTSGSMYQATYAGTTGGGYYATTGSLFFRTYSSAGATDTTFTATDPSAMLRSFMTDYGNRGGYIKYTPASIQNTGLSLTYKFNTNTVYEGIKAMLTLAPNGFYFYTDLATDVLNFKQSSTTADIIFTKDKELTSVVIKATVENIKNSVYFSGGIPTGQTTNLYKSYADTASINFYGQKLERKIDNRVTLAATADAIGNSEIAEMKDEQYQSIIKVLDKQTDISSLKVGMIVGFRGFGTFIDNLLTQIVRVDFKPEEATLTLGILQRRLMPEFERVTRGLVAQQTIANPSVPG